MDKTYTNRLFVWSLATFHTSFFFAIAILLLYWTGILGSLLSSFNTLIGFALFGVFWLVTSWTTHRALKSISGSDFKKILARPLELSKIFGYGVLWGGVNSLLFFLIVLIAFITYFHGGDSTRNKHTRSPLFHRICWNRGFIGSLPCWCLLWTGIRHPG